MKNKKREERPMRECPTKKETQQANLIVLRAFKGIILRYQKGEKGYRKRGKVTKKPGQPDHQKRPRELLVILAQARTGKVSGNSFKGREREGHARGANRLKRIPIIFFLGKRC